MYQSYMLILIHVSIIYVDINVSILMYQSYMLILIHVSIKYVDINTCINHIC